jgi:hypothetical protein
MSPLVPVAEPGSREPRHLRLASDRLPWQRSLRWKPPPRDRRLILLGLLIAILFTAVELVGFGIGMHRQIAHVVPPPRPQTITVELVEPPEALPLPPEPEPPPLAPKLERKVRVEAPKIEQKPAPRAAEEDTGAMQAHIGESGAPAPRLFNPDGSIKLAPETLEPKKRELNQIDAGRKAWADMEKRGDNPLNCKRTRFAKAFKRDESLGDEVSRKYLKWIGLGDPEGIAERAQKKEQLAEEGCDPAK